MARIWIDVYTKMLSLSTLHSGAFFPPLSAKSARNQATETSTARWLVSYDRPFFSDFHRRVMHVDKCFIFFPVRRG